MSEQLQRQQEELPNLHVETPEQRIIRIVQELNLIERETRRDK